jgi:uncharacterized protein (TIGR02145 family)
MKQITLLLFATLFLAQSCRKDTNEVDAPSLSTVLWGNAQNSVIKGRVVDESDNPVSGALVKAGDATTTTDNMGVFILNNAKVFENLGYVTVSKSGYFPGSRSFTPTEGDNIVNIRLLDKTTTGTISSSVGGTISYQGASVVFSANSFSKNNAAYNGQVNVALKYINPESTNFAEEMPGNLIAVQEGNSRGLTTFGMIAVEMTDNTGAKIELSSGQTASMSFPLSAGLQSAAPAEIDLWSFDEVNGYWKHEGKASLQNGKYVAQVSHFSFWNASYLWNPVQIDGRVTDASNNPIQGARISLHGDVNNFILYGREYTFSNTQGLFGGFVPANVVLNIRVSIPCGTSGYQSVYTGQIGPFTSNTVLPTIVTSLALSTVNGGVIDCNNAPITSGYVVANGLVYYLNNGQFSFPACGNSISISPFTSPVWSSGQTQTFSLNGGSVNVGNLTVCNTANTGTVSDIDGNVYQTVHIGTQEWMAENLRTTKYANGDMISNVTDSTQWFGLTTGAWAHYNNDSQYETPYGKLYNWYAVTDPRNVCPTGWHMPSEAEWTVLIDYLGGIPVVGRKLRSTGTQYWQTGQTPATNESGFSALPGGYTYDLDDMGYAGFWWSSTQDPVNAAAGESIAIYYDDDYVEPLGYGKLYGMSVRCLKD